MKPLTLAAIADFAKGALESGRLEDRVLSVSNDTRTLAPGALYVALRGENFDGHDFVAAAAEAGAAAVLVERGAEVDAPEGVAVVRAADTLSSLQSLAARYRGHLGLTVVGITGSSGKTSTKDLVSAVLAEEFAVSATAGNLNNHIGLPLSMLAADDRHELGVWEMGMSNPGEIELLARIASPDVAVITNIGVAHIESMGTREAIAQEKGMLAEAVGERGLVVLNAEDEFSEAIAARTRGRVCTVGFGAGDFRAEGVTVSADGTAFELVAGGERVPVRIAVPGRHMVTNALLAAAVGSHLGVSPGAVARGLGGASLAGGRLQQVEIGGVSYIDDSYNANPDSMSAAIDTLGEIACEGRRFVVVGGMAELGERSEAEHREVGRAAARAGIDFILSVGELAGPVAEGVNGDARGHVEHFSSHADCAGFLAGEARPGDLVLVKGSRSSGMEKVLEILRQK